MLIKDRIRGYLPVVVDIETAGFNEKKDAVLEICAVIIGINDCGDFFKKEVIHHHINPFEGANIEEDAIKFNGIDINNPFRMAISELDAIRNINQRIKSEIKEEECTRAILVGHNASFDLNFILAAAKRTKIKLPFHQFSTIDTVSLSSIYYGETVLAKAIKKAKIEWDDAQAHSALYDAKKTAELFCLMFNNFDYQG